MAKNKDIKVFDLPFDVNSRTLADIRGSVFNLIENNFSVGFNFNGVHKVSPSSGVGFFFKALEEVKLRGKKLFFIINEDTIKIKNEDAIIKNIDKILEIQALKQSGIRETERVFELAGEINSAAVAGIREDCEKLLEGGTRIIFNMDRVSSISPTSGMGFFLNLIDKAIKTNLPLNFTKNGNDVKIINEDELVSYAEKLIPANVSETYTNGKLEVEIEVVDLETEEIIVEEEIVTDNKNIAVDEEIVVNDKELEESKSETEETSLHFDETKAESESYVIEEELGEIIAEEKTEEEIVELDGNALNEVLEEEDVEIVKEEAVLEEDTALKTEDDIEEVIVEEEVIHSSSDIQEEKTALDNEKPEDTTSDAHEEEIIFDDVKISGIIEEEEEERELLNKNDDGKQGDDEVIERPRLFSPMPENIASIEIKTEAEDVVSNKEVINKPVDVLSDIDLDKHIESHEPELELEIDEEELDFTLDDDIVIEEEKEEVLNGSAPDNTPPEKEKHFPVADYGKERDLDDVSEKETNAYKHVLEESVVDENTVENMAFSKDDDVIEKNIDEDAQEETVEIDENYRLEDDVDAEALEYEVAPAVIENYEPEEAIIFEEDEDFEQANAQDESVFIFGEEEAKKEEEFFSDRDERLEIEETFFDIEDAEDASGDENETTVEIDESISHIVDDFAHEHSVITDETVEVDDELYFDAGIKEEEIHQAQEIFDEEEKAREPVQKSRGFYKENNAKPQNVFSDIMELPKTLTKFMDETPVKLSFLDGVQFEEEGVFDILTLIRYIHDKKPLGLMKESDYDKIMIDAKLKEFFKSSLGIKYYIETPDKKPFDIIAKRKSTGMEEVKIKFTDEENKTDISKTLTKSEEYISDFDTYFINIVRVNPDSKTPVKTFLSEHPGIQFIKKRVGNYTFLISLHRYHNRGFYRIYHFFVNPVLK